MKQYQRENILPRVALGTNFIPYIEPSARKDGEGIEGNSDFRQALLKNAPAKDDDFIIDNMSEETLSSIYKLYNDFVYGSKYTKQDIDTMYPFERQILISLLNKTNEENKK
jgi:hypothetical protein